MRHIHAAAMAEYAKDATETDMPWERWETSMTESGDEYRNLFGHPEWAATRKYRRKPKTILIGEYEVPEPCREVPEPGQKFWAVNPFAGPQGFIWDGSKEDFHALKSGFVLLTEEAAEKHYEAFKNLLAKK